MKREFSDDDSIPVPEEKRKRSRKSQNLTSAAGIKRSDGSIHLSRKSSKRKSVGKLSKSRKPKSSGYILSSKRSPSKVSLSLSEAEQIIIKSGFDTHWLESETETNIKNSSKKPSKQSGSGPSPVFEHSKKDKSKPRHSSTKPSQLGTGTTGRTKAKHSKGSKSSNTARGSEGTDGNVTSRHGSRSSKKNSIRKGSKISKHAQSLEQKRLNSKTTEIDRELEPKKRKKQSTLSNSIPVPENVSPREGSTADFDILSKQSSEIPSASSVTEHEHPGIGLLPLRHLSGVYIQHQPNSFQKPFEFDEYAHNRYNIVTDAGERLFYVGEFGLRCKRHFCGSFLLKIFDLDGHEVFDISRQCNCTLCNWCGCSFGKNQNVVITCSLTGDVFGEIVELCRFITPRYVIKDNELNSNKVIMRMEGPIASHMWPCRNAYAKYKVYFADDFRYLETSRKFVGTIMKMFTHDHDKTRFPTEEDVIGMLLPSEISPRLKSLLVGAIFCVTFSCFEEGWKMDFYLRVAVFVLLLLVIILLFVVIGLYAK